MIQLKLARQSKTQTPAAKKGKHQAPFAVPDLTQNPDQKANCIAPPIAEPKPPAPATPAQAKTKPSTSFRTLTLAERLGRKAKATLLDRITNGLTTKDQSGTAKLYREDKTKVFS
ncbi:hypothetical protein PTTG_25940 [Puccinia triticina 1-1 BBBD Race 1]|uniref:Uncharacterized protein n=1 Tax=Puccinia triticina (isolate 1-1 / race 1 (BBBD)) TaxID=630390 RepID=A0A180GXZ6_PUCT1|nr:hypothetical protein PTTG_25940 [Puccinia triticina 1-1 BBBD Race 1]